MNLANLKNKFVVFSPTRLIVRKIIFYIPRVCAPIKTTQIGEVRKKYNGQKKVIIDGSIGFPNLKWH